MSFKAMPKSNKKASAKPAVKTESNTKEEPQQLAAADKADLEPVTKSAEQTTAPVSKVTKMRVVSTSKDEANRGQQEQPSTDGQGVSAISEKTQPTKFARVCSLLKKNPDLFSPMDCAIFDAQLRKTQEQLNDFQVQMQAEHDRFQEKLNLAREAFKQRANAVEERKLKLKSLQLVCSDLQDQLASARSNMCDDGKSPQAKSMHQLLDKQAPPEEKPSEEPELQEDTFEEVEGGSQEEQECEQMDEEEEEKTEDDEEEEDEEEGSQEQPQSDSQPEGGKKRWLGWLRR